LRGGVSGWGLTAALLLILRLCAVGDQIAHMPLLEARAVLAGEVVRRAVRRREQLRHCNNHRDTCQRGEATVCTRAPPGGSLNQHPLPAALIDSLLPPGMPT